MYVAPKVQASTRPTPTPVPAPRPTNQSTVTRQPVTQRYDLASGTTSRYGSNPTNQVQKQQQQQQQQQPSAYAAYLDRLKALSEEQAARQQQRADQQARLIEDSYGRQEERAKARIPQIQEGFGKFKTNVEGQVADEETAKLEADDQTREYYGEAMRRAAEGNRSSMGNLQNIFANLGTIDSGGAMGFGGQALNQQNRFASGQQSTLKEQARELSTNQRELNQFKRDAVSLIMQEEANMNEKIALIEQTMEDGSLEKERALRQVYAEAEDRVSAIEQGLLEQEMKMAQVEQEQAIKAGENTKSSGTADVSSIVSQLLSLDTKPITGWLRLGGVIPGGQGQVAKGLYDQLMALLSVENRQMMKGSGQISDFEAKMLERAASRIRPQMSDEDFRASLMELQQALGGGQVASGGTNQNDPLGIL
jgi:hypothetical protein